MTTRKLFPQVFFGALVLETLAANIVSELNYRRASSLGGSFSLDAGIESAGKCLIWAGPLSGGTPLFRLGGCAFVGGMAHLGDLSLTDPVGGVVRTYQFWRSNQVGLGAIEMVVQGGPIT